MMRQTALYRQLKKWQPIEWIVAIIVLISAFLRLWHLPQTMQFLGDQARDAIVVSRIFLHGNPVFIGPVTSTGNMYLGPLYYYFMAPFLRMTYPNPLGPAYAVACLSILTTYLMYRWGKELVGEKAAVIASGLFAISQVVITYSRFSWNPNPAPLFGLLFLWSLQRVIKGKYWYWIGVASAIAILIQLHYVTLLTLPVAGTVWVWQVQLLWRKNSNALRPFFLSTFASILLFIASLTPLILFDIRHSFLNYNSLLSFIHESQNPVAKLPLMERVTKTVAETHGRSLHLLFEMTIGHNRQLNTLLLVCLLGILGYLLGPVRKKYHKIYPALPLLTLSYVWSVIGLSLYRGTIFDHYLEFFFPTLFFLFAVIFHWLSQKKGWGQLLAGVLIVGYAWWNLTHLPLRSLDWTYQDMERTSQTILERVQPGEKYNIVLMSWTRDLYGYSYRYYLTASDKPPVEIEHFDEASTLFIIDEQHQTQDLTKSPIYEIVVFPDKQPKEVYTVPDGGPRITVLRKSEGF